MFHSIRLLCCILSVTIIFGQAAFAAAPSPADGFNPGTYGIPMCIQPDGKILTTNDQSKFVRVNPDGSYDDSFKPAASGQIYGAVVQPDGKVIITGYSVSLGAGAPVCLARLNADGSIDAGYTPLIESYTIGINTVIVQPDGKILIAGAFKINGLVYRVARLNANGTHDAAFVASIGSNTHPTCMALLSNGKILLGVDLGALIRLYPNGSLDPTFHPPVDDPNITYISDFVIQPDGRILLNVVAHDLENLGSFARLNSNGTLDTSIGIVKNACLLDVLQPDGKFLVLRDWVENGVTRRGIQRFYPDGTIDPTYRFEADISTVNSALQPDGKLVLQGTHLWPAAGSGLIRLNLDGSLDKDFNYELNPDRTIMAMARQADGKTVIGGDFETINGIPRNRIARLNADNTLDVSFDPGAGANGNVTGMGIQPDGKIVIIGEFTRVAGAGRGGIARLNADGALDAGFNPQINGAISQIEMRPDGKFLLLGSFSNVNGVTRASVARLNQDGSIDSTFDPGPTNGTRTCMDVQSDEKVLIGGAMHAQIGTVANLIRLNPNGAIDTGFHAPFRSGSTDVTNVAVLQNGNIIATVLRPMSYSSDSVYLSCHNSDGTTNSSYRAEATFHMDIDSIVEAPDDKLLVGGDFYVNPINHSLYGNFLVRINPDGLPDPEFKGLSAPNERVRAIEVLSDGSALVVGDFMGYNGTPRAHFAQINPDGSLNTTASLVVSAPDGEVNALATDPDENLIIGGKFSSIYQSARSGAACMSVGGDLNSTFTTNMREVSVVAAMRDGKVLACDRPADGSQNRVITRRKADGTIDTAFASVTVDGPVDCMSVQLDGSVIIAGGFHHVKGFVRNQVARLTQNGALDQMFNPGDGVDLGEIVEPDDGSDENHDWIYHQSRGYLNSVAVQPDGKTIIVGHFDRAAGVDRKNIARLNANGALDVAFDPGTGTDGEILAVAIQPDGKAVIAGQFTKVNDKPRHGIARLNPDGSVDGSFVPETAEQNYFLSLALQADGKILAAGFYSSDKGYGRVARLNADGSFDTLFEYPEPLSFNFTGVHAIALQGDGKLLAGGLFEKFGQTTRRNLARISNPTGALQSLAVAPGGAGVTWRLGGSYPQPYQVLFENSSDGTNWSMLGWGTPVPGVGFAITHQRLPILTNHYVRATGWSTSGLNNGSVSVHRSTLYFYSGSYNGALDWGLYN